MDGNGRWAQGQGLPRREGHLAGVVTVKNIVKACIEKEIPVLSLWAFGQDNWSRPTDEVEFLMGLFIESLAREVESLHQHGVCLRFTGNKQQLALSLQEAMLQAESLTASNQTLILNIVMNYGGKWDILQAARQLGQQILMGQLAPEQIDEALFSSYLSTAGLPDPDLFIRTSGEQRISNFFLWQLSYTELFFSPVCWPDFTAQELEHALESFRHRERRYGKISAQLTAADEGFPHV